MAVDAKCKICRRVGRKLFLKGEKCFSQKCPMVKRPYPPGSYKKRQRALSEYGKELLEKQRIRRWYNLSERQFRNYVKEALKALKAGSRTENADEVLIRRLESRLDNVIWRLGLATSRIQARQLVSHGHFLVNKKPVNVPSFSVRKGDVINIRPSSQNKTFFKNRLPFLKKHQPPSWLKFDISKLEGEVIGLPNLEEAAPPAEISSIFEFYSK